MSSTIIAVVGIAVTVLGGLLGAAWILSGRISRVEARMGALPEQVQTATKLALAEHCLAMQDRCPARQEYITDVRAKRG